MERYVKNDIFKAEDYAKDIMNLIGYLYIRDESSVPLFLLPLYKFLINEVIEAMANYEDCLIVRDEECQKVCIEAIDKYYEERDYYDSPVGINNQ